MQAWLYIEQDEPCWKAKSDPDELWLEVDSTETTDEKEVVVKVQEGEMELQVFFCRSELLKMLALTE